MHLDKSSSKENDEKERLSLRHLTNSRSSEEKGEKERHLTNSRSSKEKDENERHLTNSKRYEDEENPFVDLKNFEQDDPLKTLYAGMMIEADGHQHQVQGLNLRYSSKAYGDSNEYLPIYPELEKYYNDNANGGDTKRNFMRWKKYFWDKNVVPYTFVDGTTQATKDVFDLAIQQFNETTCIRWVPGETAADYNLDHNNVITIFNGVGCWSYLGNVGMYFNNSQPLSLQTPDCLSRNIAVHEMMHAIGSWHEQSRTDRDKYMDILWENINPSFVQNFKKSPTQDNNYYDIGSTMQYYPYAFSINGLKTIQFKDSRLEFLVYIPDGLGFYDIKDVNDAYHCADHCKDMDLECQNAGFLNFECVCYCPEGLDGPNCEHTVSNDPSCGGIINLGAGEVQYIQSPNYLGNYPTGLECTWLIKGEKNNLIRASVEYMDLAWGDICYHWLEYRYNLLGQIGPKRCGTNFNPGEEVWDTTLDEFRNEFMIKFNSNLYSAVPGTSGFSLKIQHVGKGCISNPCVYGKCYSPEGTSSYTCTCHPGFLGQKCDQLSFTGVVGCTFEYGELCFLDNLKDDQLDWDITNGPTFSLYTGPQKAHSGFQYIYTEASYPRVFGDKAVMVNNVLELPSVPRCLSFWYHMYGATINTLNVYTEGKGIPKSLLFTKSGSQGDVWYNEEFDIPAMTNLKVYFESIRGLSYTGDIALDDIVLTPGSCV